MEMSWGFWFFSKIKSTFKEPGFISFGNARKGYPKHKKQFDGFKTLTFMEPPKDEFLKKVLHLLCKVWLS